MGYLSFIDVLLTVILGYALLFPETGVLVEAPQGNLLGCVVLELLGYGEGHSGGLALGELYFQAVCRHQALS